MAIYWVDEEALRPVEATSFADVGLREREDLQRLLRDQIDAVAPDVLVISEEFSEWTNSQRRIDLLGIDKHANIVVIELKRTEDGGHMELQALRYAAMASTLTAARAIEIFATYLAKREKDTDAEKALLEFLDWDAVDEDEFGQDVRIVLVSADFSRELTSAVIWLNEKELDIRCVRIRPNVHKGDTLIDVQQVIPLPESADFQVMVREKKRQERASRERNKDFTRHDIQINGSIHENQWKRNSMLLVVKALVSDGVDPMEIHGNFKDWGRGNAFAEVDDEIVDVDEFFAILAENTEEAGKNFSIRRWHRKDGDLLKFGGKTYALTNQWGVNWPTFMLKLKETYPQIELDYWPTGTK